MSAGARLRELARPPAHRGPLVAAGAVALAVGVALAELRLVNRLGAGAHLALLAPAAAVVLGLGLQAEPEDGRPPAFASALLVAGLALAWAALLRLADVVVGAGAPGAGSVAWTGAVIAALAARAARRQGSAVCALLAAAAAAVAALALAERVLDPETLGPFRWLLLALAAAYALGAVALRARWYDHSVQLVNAAGLAVLGVAATFAIDAVLAPFSFAFPESPPAGWEAVLLAGGWGLLAYAAVDRQPGPAYLGVAVLAAFVLLAGAPVLNEETVRGWPVLVGILGLVALGAGLRPRRPLPPEPERPAAPAVPLPPSRGRAEPDDGSRR